MIESGKNELPVIIRSDELVREMTRRTGKLPRDLKFVLGDRILNTSGLLKKLLKPLDDFIQIEKNIGL